MLTKDLLEVTKRKPNIQPRYRGIDEYLPAAERVLEAYEVGQTRGEIESELAELETHDTFKLVRGLSKLVEDRYSAFTQEVPLPPPTLREAVFDRGYVTTEAEREQVLAEVAADHDLTQTEVENGLWADREPNHVLASKPDIGPKALLREYNLSLTQTLLFDAVELEFTASGNYQEIFSLISYLGLMYTVGEDLTVTVTGPASLFEKTRKYGTALAKLVPSIMKAQEWSLSAQVETEVSDETRIYEFTLDSDRDHLFPERTADESFDSEVERDFATRIDALAEGWTVTREPTILRTGNRVMIPDFSFERDGTELYLEVIGFWTPAYLEEKLAKVREVESQHPLILAVNETLNCTKADFEDANADQIFFYDEQIPVKPVVNRLQAIDDRQAAADLERLQEQEFTIGTADILTIASVAESQSVQPAAMKEYLRENYSGVISNGKFVPETVLSELEAEIDTEIDGSANNTLGDVNPILAEYGVGQEVLEEIGYTITYTSLDQEEARITKSAGEAGDDPK